MPNRKNAITLLDNSRRMIEMTLRTGTLTRHLSIYALHPVELNEAYN